MNEAGDKIRCDACPVLCYIRSGMTGACDRYANRDGQLVRVDPHLLLDRTLSEGGKVVPFVNAEAAWSGGILRRPGPLVTISPPRSSFPPRSMGPTW
jgi:hypothetical protein